MKKVMIIGNAGGGKSRLAQRVADHHGLALTRLDDLLWQPGWQRTPDADFIRQHDELLRQPNWVLDGYGPTASINPRLGAADTVIFVDLPFRTHVWWATKRQFKSLFSDQGPPGCPMWRKTVPLYAMMWDLHKNARPGLLSQIQSARHLRLIHLQTIRDLNRFATAPD